MLITKEIEIDMGHRVPNHKSKCRNLHGHRYKIEVGVEDKIITTSGASDEGMVIDYSDLKDIMINTLDAMFDHGFMMYREDKQAPRFQQIIEEEGLKIHFVNFIPTAENIAECFYFLLKFPLEERKIKIKHVKIWETPTSTALYEEV